MSAAAFADMVVGVVLGVLVPVGFVGVGVVALRGGVVRDGVLVLGGVVVGDTGLFAGLVAGFVLGRLVLPPPIVPPPLAGSCWANALGAVASRHTNTEREIRGRRRVDISFLLRLRLRLKFKRNERIAVGHYSVEGAVVETVLTWRSGMDPNLSRSSVAR